MTHRERRPLLNVKDLSVRLGRPGQTVVRKISFSLDRGEILGLAGESGSGKSVTALALARLLPGKALPVVEGEVRLAGERENLVQASERRLRRIRGRRISYIFQEPSSSFNPVYPIGSHLREVLKVSGVPRRQQDEEIAAVLNEVGLVADAAHLEAYPPDFSGGMLQRAALACALLSKPDLLVADEATTALDTTTQARVVRLLQDLNKRHGLGILFISHDLGLIRQICSRTLIMRRGHLVESGFTADILTRPAHPYTRELIDSLPRLRR